MDQSPELATGVVPVWDRRVVTLPVFALIALVGGLFPSFTLSANLLVLAIGGTMVWLGATARAARRPAPRRLPGRAGWWLAPVLLLGMVELFTFSRHSVDDYPTLSLLADPILDHYLPRAAAYFGWLYGFWGLVRR